MPLSESAVDQLEELLFDKSLSDDTLDYFGLHGLVSATVVGPVELTIPQITNICLAEQTLSGMEKELDHLAGCIAVMQSELIESLTEGSSIILPFEDEDEHYDDALISWCAGFVEGILNNESDWFNQNEEISAELLLPYMALSGLFDNEDFAPIINNKKLMQQFETIIAEQLTDVFLFYHSKA
ncbi:hypothetical protein A3715_33055 [Oleiphilus sp. HI0009]|nr:hypothetical protein A3715_11205 [Oleiphilus sp. HI0009]KZX82931.1 hypothetical protein A3715_33055 [Oleiphilus sp. HI0009]